ncbi:hypothetical protein PsorP6_000704 [Peronosclerospora sorghi]|uniref:Uncharacterized protein n=1 Tax=Peronosclerospora sorghi TaxID=230839 RepID=A0ACC0WWK8_9STRA|nr:hypothetical protein PsorP6_000704 [Peronosclerospora sorghi]
MSNSSPCRFFQSPQGCYRGASCSFRHAVESCSTNPLNNSSTSYAKASTSPRPCYFFLSESGCRNGHTCLYLHGTTTKLSGTSAAAHDEAQAPAKSSSRAVVSTHLVAGMHPKDEHARVPTKSSALRPKMNIQANPQKKEKISDIPPVLTRDIQGPFFAIDVECVATGNGTNDRDVARIAVVDEDEQVIFDQYVKPTKHIVSYLTQLTGITKSNLANAPNLNQALVQLKRILPMESVIVGQSIKKDLEWLRLHKPQDYKGEFDVADLFRLPMQSTNGIVHYRYFSLRHVVKYLLGHEIQEADHDPIIDARYAMKVFKQFRYLHENPSRRDAVLQTLLKTPRTPSFAERYPVIDGVSMRPPRKADTFSYGASDQRTKDDQHGQDDSLDRCEHRIE